MGFTKKPSSDIDDDIPAVDTDDASLDSSGKTTASDTESSTGSDTEAEPATGGSKPSPATKGKATMQPATGGKKPKYFQRGHTIYDNGYFLIRETQHYHIMHIQPQWLVAPPVGIGRSPTMSKTITFTTIGEIRENVTRCPLLLKAWMLWRARMTPGWIESDGARMRLFREEADAIVLAVKSMQPTNDGLLGNAVATRMLYDWVPDLVARVRD